MEIVKRLFITLILAVILQGCGLLNKKNKPLNHIIVLQDSIVNSCIRSVVSNSENATKETLSRIQLNSSEVRFIYYVIGGAFLPDSCFIENLEDCETLNAIEKAIKKDYIYALVLNKKGEYIATTSGFATLVESDNSRFKLDKLLAEKAFEGKYMMYISFPNCSDILVAYRNDVFDVLRIKGDHLHHLKTLQE